MLLHLYADRGADMVHALRGMFAFGIWDARERKLLLARDPFGIKPLYYADDGNTLRFASQVKALLAGGALRSRAGGRRGTRASCSGVRVPEPFTLHRGIQALPAGCTLAVSPRGVGAPRSYFDVGAAIAAAEAQGADRSLEARAQLRDALEDTVAAHLVADTPVGLFLSAGVDSTALANVAAVCAGAGLRGVTLGFDRYAGTPRDEVPLSVATAARLGIDHRIERVGDADFEAALPELLDAMDQPTIDGVNTYFVSRAAHRAGMKVALSGVGGDELFAGYPSFLDVPRSVAAFGWASRFPALGRGFRVATGRLCEALTSPKYAGLLEYGGTWSGAYLLRRGLFMPWELPRLLEPEFAREGWARLASLATLQETAGHARSERWRVGALELAFYMRNTLLRDTDWASMAHSLEVRVPFVDRSFAGTVAAMRRDHRWPVKSDLGAAAAVPDEIVARAKTGFTVPVRDWLARRDWGTRRHRGLRGWALHVLAGCRRDRRIQCLVTDAYGGRGGIAKFNCDLLDSLGEDPRYRRITAVARHPPSELACVPERVVVRAEAARGLYAYARCVLLEARSLRAHDAILCGHINLLPLAWLGKLISGAKLILVLHGIDAWQPTRRALIGSLVRHVDLLVSVSRFTFERFRQWARHAPADCFVLPNAVDLSQFAPGERRAELAREYGVEGKKVVLTLARLSSEERYKGVDEVLEALPQIAEHEPDICYLIAGTGNDVERLQAKAHALGQSGRVRFAGFVDDSRKADVYRLADAYVMPGSGEGFGIVYLEAMACGIPVLGSTLDASGETLMGGRLGALADPRDRADVVRGVLDALSRPRSVPAGLERYSVAQFRARVRGMSDRVWSESAAS